MSKTLLVHGSKGNARLKGYLANRQAQDSTLLFMFVIDGKAEALKPKKDEEFEAIISGELDNVQELVSGYKKQGVCLITILGKEGPPPEEETDVEVEHPADAQADT